MFIKKNLPTQDISNTPFMDVDFIKRKIIEKIIDGAIAAGIILVTMYFAIRTQGDQIHAQDIRNDAQDTKIGNIDDKKVEKAVQEETDRRLEQKIDLILEFWHIQNKNETK